MLFKNKNFRCFLSDYERMYFCTVKSCSVKRILNTFTSDHRFRKSSVRFMVVDA